jgi:hypothetical protein
MGSWPIRHNGFGHRVKWEISSREGIIEATCSVVHWCSSITPHVYVVDTFNDANVCQFSRLTAIRWSSTTLGSNIFLRGSRKVSASIWFTAGLLIPASIWFVPDGRHSRLDCVTPRVTYPKLPRNLACDRLQGQVSAPQRHNFQLAHRYEMSEPPNWNSFSHETQSDKSFLETSLFLETRECQASSVTPSAIKDCRVKSHNL